MMNQPSAKIPKEVAQLLSSGLVKGIEYAGESVLVVVSNKELFSRVLEGSGIELVEVSSEKIVFRIPLSFLSD
jgi:hypothetical protein